MCGYCSEDVVLPNIIALKTNFLPRFWLNLNNPICPTAAAIKSARNTALMGMSGIISGVSPNAWLSGGYGGLASCPPCYNVRLMPSSGVRFKGRKVSVPVALLRLLLLADLPVLPLPRYTIKRQRRAVFSSSIEESAKRSRGDVKRSSEERDAR